MNVEASIESILERVDTISIRKLSDGYSIEAGDTGSPDALVKREAPDLITALEQAFYDISPGYRFRVMEMGAPSTTFCECGHQKYLHHAVSGFCGRGLCACAGYVPGLPPADDPEKYRQGEGQR